MELSKESNPISSIDALRARAVVCCPRAELKALAAGGSSPIWVAVSVPAHSAKQVFFDATPLVSVLWRLREGAERN